MLPEGKDGRLAGRAEWAGERGVAMPWLSVVSGSGFLVTEGPCGCRRHFYLDLHSLIMQATAAPPGGPAARAHVPPLPPAFPHASGGAW
jgi:hypothetical protein